MSPKCSDFLILLSLQPNYSFMPVVPGLVFFMYDFPRRPQGDGVEVGKKETASHIGEGCLTLSASLFVQVSAVASL